MHNEWTEGWLCQPHNKKFCHECNMTIEWSTNPQWIGKTEKLEKHGKVFQSYGGEIVSLGNKWENVQSTLIEFFDNVSEAGLAVGPALLESPTGNRSEGTFKSHQVALVDIDNGMTLDELVENDIYEKYAAGFYTSPSHRDEHHKFRIVFVLEQPITNAADLRRLYSGLIALFGGDEACKDGARLFFGTIKAAVKEFDCSRRLPQKIVNTIIKGAEQDEHQVEENRSHLKPPEDEQKRLIVEQLQKCDLSKYADWFKVCTAMKHSGFDLDDFVAVSSCSYAECKQYWEDVKGNRQVMNSVGTLIWMIKEQLGDNAETVTTVVRKDRQEIVRMAISKMMNKESE